MSRASSVRPAAGVLAGRQQGDAWERLIRSATVNNPEERATAIRMLGETKDSRALPILQPALKDTQPSVRGAAAAAMGNLQTRASVEIFFGKGLASLLKRRLGLDCCRE